MTTPNKPVARTGAAPTPAAKPAPKPAGTQAKPTPPKVASPKPGVATGAKPAAGKSPAPAQKGAPKAAPKVAPEKPRNIPQPPKKRTPSKTPLKLVEKPPAAEPLWRQYLKEPERLGRVVFERPSWLDEAGALLLVIFGLVTLLTLLNSLSSPLSSAMSGTVSIAWVNLLRQIFGTVGAGGFAVMLILGGILIVLPKIGILIPSLLRRIIWIEVAFFALLAIAHLLAADREPRALARSGGGGGYIGWALSQVILSLFGSVVALGIFLFIFATGVFFAAGVRRTHVRILFLRFARYLSGTALQLRQTSIPRPDPIAAARSARQLVSRFTPSRRPEPILNSISTQAPIPTQASIESSRLGNLPVLPVISSSVSPQNQSGTGEPLSPPVARISLTIAPTPADSPAMTVRDPAMDLPPEPPRSTQTTQTPLYMNQANPESSAKSPDLPVLPDLSESIQAGSVQPPPSIFAKPVPKARPIAKSEQPGLAPVRPSSSKTPKPVPPPKPVPLERVRRTFAVSDFNEVRHELKRDGLPPIALLNETELNRPTPQEINENARIIEDTLEEFDLDVEVVDVNVGPTVTQYAVQPFREIRDDQGGVKIERVRVQKVINYAQDLALALSAKRLRIEPYVPGKSYMGIEVPNRVQSVVALRPVLESENFANAYAKPDPEAKGGIRELPLVVPLGRDVSGAAVAIDLASMPHLLIAGTTGSGKSVAITAMALSLIINNTPDRLKMVMLDPKMVELVHFNGIPHLLGPVETDLERIVGVLRWSTREMERRYKLLEAEGARNIEAYNRTLGDARKDDQLPYIAIFVDEIGDLMLSRPDETERTLTRLAQMARAVGMHLIVATQRPSVDIITGLIKANFPARISFAVASGTDSRVILDSTGAETLMGRGDMLYLAPDANAPRRVQGCYVSEAELEQVIGYWREWKKAHPAPEAEGEAPWERGLTRREALSDQDAMLEQAIEHVVKQGVASVSIIQRGLNIPYPRAATLMDLLGTLGILGASEDGGRSKKVLLKPGTDTYKRLMNKYRR